MVEKIIEILHRIHPDSKRYDITDQTRLEEDLKFDSLTMFSLLVELEEAFGFRFTSHVTFETVADVYGYLDSRI